MADNIILGLMIPFAGTTLGAALSQFMKGDIKPPLQKVLGGFAAGVMMAASVWSLLLPAIDKAGELGGVPWVPAALGFLAGIGFLLLLDSLIPHLHMTADEPEGLRSAAKKNTMLMLAVTLHNIPEGIAVGVVFGSGGRPQRHHLFVRRWLLPSASPSELPGRGHCGDAPAQREVSGSRPSPWARPPARWSRWRPSSRCCWRT